MSLREVGLLVYSQGIAISRDETIIRELVFCDWTGHQAWTPLSHHKHCFLIFFSQIMPLTIYTGGAKGVDTHVERLCHLYGHVCVVLIPPCHPRAMSLAPLTQSDLDAAEPTVTQVAFRLGRQIHHPISLPVSYTHLTLPTKRIV